MVRSKGNSRWVPPSVALKEQGQGPTKRTTKRKSTALLAEEAARDAAEAAEAMGQQRTRKRARVSKVSANKPTVKKARKKRAPKLTGEEKLLLECEETAFQITPEGQQMLEVLEGYTKAHLVTTEPFVLRELLRSAHKCMPAGPPKSKLRGILAYYTRSPIMVTWSKLSQVLNAVAAQENLTTFEKEKDVPGDRIVDETTILRMRANPRYADRIEVLDTKIKALKIERPAAKQNKPRKKGPPKATTSRRQPTPAPSSEFDEDLPDLESFNNTSESLKELFGEANLSF